MHGSDVVSVFAEGTAQHLSIISSQYAPTFQLVSGDLSGYARRTSVHHPFAQACIKAIRVLGRRANRAVSIVPSRYWVLRSCRTRLDRGQSFIWYSVFVVSRYMNYTSRSSVFLSLSLVGVTMLLATAFSVAVPSARDAVFGEDRLVEWMTVVAFAAAFVLGVHKLRSRAPRDLFLMAVTILAGLAVLDELSFGERILGWEAPYILGTKLDAVHDLFRIGQKLIKQHSDYPYLVAGALGLAACSFIAVLVVWLRRFGWKLTLGAETVLIATAVVCLVVAQGIDINLRIIRSDILKPIYVEEILELGAGLLFLLFTHWRGTGFGSRRAASEPAHLRGLD